ncbi:hypothetical protein KP509_09G086300 [Ceratopteris richardii]|uniref:RING-type E3 ubiquitin transferase n=1 Tax=Ceratopteris richardii TaxID=49495 RepID=A0A8T2U308_CERRI|nr:hypothetical protein KP509_09G086300 [Ceratopteris richardii]KAH7430157.1 hypothetical protein KP509_09G086300 [Ceratopteris richardii]KAH7430158.1 hypothetical protein KP509_09G086300 [Ceratopteris richardii]
MGNGSSRQRRNESSVQSPQRMYSLPPGPVSFTPLPPYSSTQSSNFPSSPFYSGYNGPMQPPHFYPPGYHGYHPDYQTMPPPPRNYQTIQASNALPAPPPVVGSPSAQQHSTAQQQTITIHNAVNIKKNTITLFEDGKNPGFYLLSFSYDAEFPGSFNIFYFAKEDERDGSIKPWNLNAYVPVRLPFEKGTSNKFEQASGTGIYLDAFDTSLLEKEQPVEGCPLVIRAHISSGGDRADSACTPEEVGAALPKSVNSQVTQAVIERKDNGDCKVHVLRQIIWVDGVRYEVKELYGVESTAVDKNGYDEEDFGKECVICMSEHRDTAVLPCRHVCMCHDCASTFESQMNRCPICRQPVQSLMKIKV